MRGLRTVLVAAFGAFALAGCAPQDGPQPPTPPAGGETAQNQSYDDGLGRDMNAADRAACEAAGGTVQRRGRLGMEQCVHAYADAGKQCTDSAQCQGKCVGSAGAVSPDKAASGICQADDRLYGCYAEVRNGKAVAAICVD
ncbi:MAG: hypothetical protein K0R64_1286 [Novosphingobium lindaniclasticum]|jgi:hypothetical protein|uniref:hypothetical protein n=1 Tax=Novosphingobium lindaniclasticum TaxID=1329895 RepID=UPI00240919C3|nr:hypothetical protein [Novosphingobium lindaniclasticum]MDF2638302.1 hypothetical protein [Novosphingobium lindaniclasticum]